MARLKQEQIPVDDVRVCPECAAEYGPGWRYCAACGTDLDTGARPAATAAPTRSLSRWRIGAGAIAILLIVVIWIDRNNVIAMNRGPELSAVQVLEIYMQGVFNLMVIGGICFAAYIITRRD